MQMVTGGDPALWLVEALQGAGQITYVDGLHYSRFSIDPLMPSDEKQDHVYSPEPVLNPRLWPVKLIHSLNIDGTGYECGHLLNVMN